MHNLCRYVEKISKNKNREFFKKLNQVTQRELFFKKQLKPMDYPATIKYTRVLFYIKCPL